MSETPSSTTTRLRRRLLRRVGRDGLGQYLRREWLQHATSTRVQLGYSL